MSSALPRQMTLAEFLDWEDRQEARHEFDGSRPLEMPDVTVGHSMVANSLRVGLHLRLRGGPCHVFGPSMKIKVANHIRYPDVFVHCSKVSPRAMVIRDPVVICEVRAQETSRDDQIARLREYRGAASLRHYVVLEWNTVSATVFTRSGGDWPARPLAEADTLILPEIGVELPMREIYAELLDGETIG